MFILLSLKFLHLTGFCASLMLLKTVFLIIIEPWSTHVAFDSISYKKQKPKNK